MKTEDGGSAFPEIGRTFDNDSQEHVYCSTGGMTLRDHFAAKALQGILAYAGDEQRGSHHNNNDAAGVAEMAYQYADSMIAARGRQ